MFRRRKTRVCESHSLCEFTYVLNGLCSESGGKAEIYRKVFFFNPNIYDEHMYTDRSRDPDAALSESPHSEYSFGLALLNGSCEITMPRLNSADPCKHIKKISEYFAQ